MTYSIDLITASLNYYKISKNSIRNVAKIFGIGKSVLNNWNKNLPLKYANIESIKITIKPEMLKYVKNSLNQNPYRNNNKKYIKNNRLQ